MRKRWLSVGFALAALALPAGGGPTGAAPGLQLVFGPEGLVRVAYRGVMIDDVTRWTNDRMHIWHMRCLNTAGQELKTPECSWGENNRGRAWDAATKRWTYSFLWGNVQVQYLQQGDTLNVTVTAVNRGDSGLVFDGASVFPLTLHLPGLSGALSNGASRVTRGIEEPGVTAATWAGGKVLAISSGPEQVAWTGWQATQDSGVAAILSGTRPDNGPVEPGASLGMSLRPGSSASLKLSVRFLGPEGSVLNASRDAYRRFVAQWPESLHWKDRRIIGTVYLASSAQGEKTHGAGFPGNPRRYFNETLVNVRDPAGLAAFQGRVLGQAAAVVENLRRMDGQGAITWDLEGEEYPQDTSYVCAPDKIAQVSPEMESLVSDRSSPYAGMKLDDAYFRLLRDAGFRVGVCVRPQRFTLQANGTARQVSLPDSEAALELLRKIRYAHDRWGATLFYIDSTVRADGSTLPAAVLEQAAAAVPDSLVIPEESSERMYRATAPFKTFLFHGDLGTSAEVQAVYPQAFSVNLVNDVDPARLMAAREALMGAVRKGDVLMVHGDYWQANNATVQDIYREARRRGQR